MALVESDGHLFWMYCELCQESGEEHEDSYLADLEAAEHDCT